MQNNVVVIPNINGQDVIVQCIASLEKQTVKPHIIVVDNGSSDKSVEIIRQQFPDVELIVHDTNRGYAGGVNPGFQRAIDLQARYVAAFNNDAVADPRWLKSMVAAMDHNPALGAANPKVLHADGTTIDTVGEAYTTWGLPYPRGRGETDSGQYDSQTEIFAASGAASLYRVAMLEEIGLLDEDFFAYYEDVDLSFRAQLAGWKIAYVPTAVVCHATSTTGAKIKGFFTMQTQKNLPMLLVKNVPRSLLPTVLPRFILVYLSFFVAALQRGQFFYAFQGYGGALAHLPKKLQQRREIQGKRKVSDDYIASMWVWDLPPNAERLRKVRGFWRKLRGNRA